MDTIFTAEIGETLVRFAQVTMKCWHSLGNVQASEEAQVNSTIDAHCEKLTFRARDNNIVAWLRTNLAKALNDIVACHEDCPEFPGLGFRRDGTPVGCMDVVDWLNGLPDRKLGRLDRVAAKSAFEAAGAWHDRMEDTAAARAGARRPSVPGRLVATLGGGWSAFSLEDAESMKAEGDAMGHCVGGHWYHERVKAEKIIIISLRDSAGRSFATVEIDVATKKINQLQGPGNKSVAQECLAPLSRLLNAAGVTSNRINGPIDGLAFLFGAWILCNDVLGAVDAKVRSIARLLESDATEILFATAMFGLDARYLAVATRHGADVRAMDCDGSTPLHHAAMQSDVKVAEVLLDAGADKSAKDSCYVTPLHCAALCGRVEAFKALLEAGTDKDAVTYYGSTPLHYAAEGGHAEIVKILLGVGVDKNAMSSTGSTPLHLAAEDGHANVVNILIDAGAYVSVHDNAGRTPLDRAKLNRQLSVVKILYDAIFKYD